MRENNGSIQTNLVDIIGRRIGFSEISWRDGVILSVRLLGSERAGCSYLMPGFVDAHVHIESSMLTPVEFSRLAVRHGTVATVSDPHEIANVLGLEGVRFMVGNAAKTPMKILFGAPSCVPATAFETAGAKLGMAELESLFQSGEAGFLSEMMNFPGVLSADPEVMEKLALAKRFGLPVDGHAPGLTGQEAGRYAAAGIGTDHECRTMEEALDKIGAGMKIQIREGSAARDFEALHELIRLHPDKAMFCSDDKHPDDLQRGHIDRLAARAVAKGHDLYAVLRCACLNAVEHYRLPVGLLREGDPMDAVLVDDLKNFQPIQTWIDGLCVASRGVSMIRPVKTPPLNFFRAGPVGPEDFAIRCVSKRVRVIKAFDEALSTEEWLTDAKTEDGCIVPDTDRDILLLTVINRYRREPPAVALVNGFGLNSGALASTVAHDSHNIIAVGADIDSLCRAVNGIVALQGGIAAVDARGRMHRLGLPVAGLMTDADADQVAAHYVGLDRQAKALGSNLRAPFMTLSFMALLVIPQLKLSDRGLFDGRSFGFTPLTA